MKIVDQHAPQVGIAAACRAVEVSRARWYRRRQRAAATTAPEDRR